MLLLIKYISKLLKALSSEDSPSQIAGGFILGMIIGLTPLFSFHNLIIATLIIIFKVNIGMVLLAFFVFSGVGLFGRPRFFIALEFGFWKTKICSKPGFLSMKMNGGLSRDFTIR